jgi:biotin carboxyl carrier protein
MSNYRVNIGKRTYDVKIQKDGLFVNGDRFILDMESLSGNGLHILHHGNRTVEAYLQSTQKGTYEVQIDGNHLCAEVNLGFQKRNRVRSPATGQLFSPMPGLIVDILVKEGDRVQKGDTLLVQEAMKMQMRIRTPSTGTIKSITTTTGHQVEKGTLLISMEPENTTTQ